VATVETNFTSTKKRGPPWTEEATAGSVRSGWIHGAHINVSLLCQSNDCGRIESESGETLGPFVANDAIAAFEAEDTAGNA
jgi:hypothetical protein